MSDTTSTQVTFSNPSSKPIRCRLENPFPPIIILIELTLTLLYVFILKALTLLITDTDAHHTFFHGTIVLYSPLITMTALGLAFVFFATRVIMEYTTGTSVLKRLCGYIIWNNSTEYSPTRVQLMIRNAWILALPLGFAFGYLPMIIWSIMWFVLIMTTAFNNRGQTFLDQYAGTRVVILTPIPDDDEPKNQLQ